MDPKTQSDTNKKQSRFKDLVVIVLGIIVFVIISSLLIYEGGKALNKNYSSFFSPISNEIDSISSGDASVVGVVNKINNLINDKDKAVDLPVASTSIVLATSTVINSDIQYVILSFDGSRSLPMWNETRQFAKDMIAKGKPVHFTYFINPIYLITRDAAQKNYLPPREKMGASLIGYANNGQDVKNRVEQINLAYTEGHEIGSHNVGHFNGSKWSQDEWVQESNSFDSIIANVQKNNPDVVIPPWTFGLSQFIGFRAPELGVNNNLYKALSQKKYLYDTSGMRMPNKYPVKDKEGVWHIGLGIIKMKDLHSNTSLKNNSRYVLSMDYNFWMAQSNVKNVAKKGTPLWNAYFSEMKDAYLDYFNNNYEGNHAPVVIGHHFSAWNDGVYWKVMKSFAEDVCGKPKVKCVTFREYVDYLNSAVK
jgi:peptidoglycan/xylan/chitin deacetylase (PgdA/CDA1 family)